MPECESRQQTHVAILGRRGRRPLLARSTLYLPNKTVAILGRRGRRPLPPTGR